ncbi:unnamed protein product [Parajaminaea phylloscopi]
MPLIVHHLNDSRSQRVLWLLEELGIDYEIKHYQRGADRRAPKELKDVHPLGKSPVITTEDGRVIAESGAIVEYLIAKYGNGKFQPTTADGQLDNSFWSHFAEGSLMPALVMKLLFTIIPQQAPFLVRPIANAICSGVQSGFIDPEIAKLVTFVAAELDKKASASPDAAHVWFAGGDADGNPTAADFQMLFPLEAATLGGRLPKNVQVSEVFKQWAAKVHKRPAYQAALAKGGPYSYA